MGKKLAVTTRAHKGIHKTALRKVDISRIETPCISLWCVLHGGN